MPTASPRRARPVRSARRHGAVAAGPVRRAEGARRRPSPLGYGARATLWREPVRCAVFFGGDWAQTVFAGDSDLRRGSLSNLRIKASLASTATASQAV